MDLANRTDVQSVVERFYEKALNDPEIGYFFTEVVPLDFSVHLPRIIDFWESVLFGVAQYQGNPVLKHIELHHLSSLKKKHFDRWHQLWSETIRSNFEGEKANEAINKAKMMADLMMYKIEASEQGGFIQ